MKHNDRQVAEYIRKGVKLSDKLDAATVEDLQGAGAGPQTVAALKALITASADLSVAPPPPPKPVYVGPPAPDAIEQKAIPNAQRVIAYFLCPAVFLCTSVKTQKV